MPLHPQASAFLKELSANDPPAWSSLPPTESRKIFNGFQDLFGDGPDVASKDLDAGGVPIRVYYPSNKTKAPAVVYFHGGGWLLGNIETHDTLCRRISVASGRVVVSVDYRLAPEHPYPAALDDCYAATEFVFRECDQLGIDSTKIAVAGDSAGGNLAAAVALKARDTRRENSGPDNSGRENSGPESAIALAGGIESQVLIYPVVEPNFDSQSYLDYATGYMLTRDGMRWFWEQYIGDLDSDTLRSATYAVLSSQVDLSDLPPSMVLTAEYDVLRSEGESFAQRLSDAGNVVHSKNYDGMLHGFVHFSAIFQDGLTAIEDIGAFLKS